MSLRSRAVPAKYTTLTESLAELERTNPAVAKAAANYDRVSAMIRGVDYAEGSVMDNATQAARDPYLHERFEALQCALTQPCVASHEEPAELVSVANRRGISRQAAMAKASGVKAQRQLGERIAAAFEATTLTRRLPTGPTGSVDFWVIVITRIAPRMLDSDNLESCGKGVRDGVAAALGVDDRDPLIRYVMSQRQGEPRQKLVRAELFIQPKESQP